MAGVSEPFDAVVARHCPSDAGFYFCERVSESGVTIRVPSDRALKVNPFEWPVGAKAGAWMVHYCRDAQGHVVIPHVGGKSLVVAHLSYPSEVCDPPEGASDAELMALLASKDAEAENEDDADGSLKATRIEAKKREIALDLTAKEQKLARRAAVNKELVEGYLLNRAHRLEVRDQSEAMYRVQNQTLAMSERNLALIEKIQESLGRVAELEKSASQRAATPPPPIDYSPVLNSVVGAIRDIGVSALQRDSRNRPRAEDDAAPVKANLADKPAVPSSAAASTVATVPPAAAAIGPAAPSPVPALPAAGQPSVAELLAETERLRAERDRMEAELVAERKRQLVLAELAAEPPRAAAPPTTNAIEQREGAPQTRTEARPPVPAVPRNAPCPCGSGQKYKRCCLGKQQPAPAAASPPSTAKPKPPPEPKTEPAVSAPHPAKPSSEPTGSGPPAAPGNPAGSTAPTVSPAASSSAAPSAGPSKPVPAAASDRAAAAVPRATPEPKPKAEPSRSATSDTPTPATPPPAPESARVGEQIQELLVNAMASKMLADPDAPIPAPLVSQVGQLEEVLVAPPKMDPETARKLLKDGTALEAFGAFLFFNPAIRTMLLSRRGK